MARVPARCLNRGGALCCHAALWLGEPQFSANVQGLELRTRRTIRTAANRLARGLDVNSFVAAKNFAGKRGA